MLCFDIETGGISPTSVVLSASILYFDPREKLTYQQLLDSTFFIKFNVVDQLQRLKRTTDKSTLDWWNTQSDYARKINLIPTKTDVTVETGLQLLNKYVKSYPESSIIWARGSMDEAIITNLYQTVDIEMPVKYNQWRDIRTAVDILYGSTNGYCDVEHPEFNKDMVIKHLPYHDVCYDVMMLLYGKEK